MGVTKAEGYALGRPNSRTSHYLDDVVSKAVDAVPAATRLYPDIYAWSVVDAVLNAITERQTAVVSPSYIPLPEGWFVFGTHMDEQRIQLEFSEEKGEDGLPLWERPTMKHHADHEPVQHRDDKSPWCHSCGLHDEYHKPSELF